MRIGTMKDMEQEECAMLEKIGELLDEAVVFADGRWFDATRDRLDAVRDSYRMFMKSISNGSDDGVIRFKVGRHYRVFMHGKTCEPSVYFVILVRERTTFSDGTTVMTVDVMPCPFQDALIPYVTVRVDVSENRFTESIVSDLFGNRCRCSATDEAVRKWC